MIRDRQTGLIVCEECGSAVKNLTEASYQKAQYIWEVNSAWPSFSSFEDLISQIIAKDLSIPPCDLVKGTPSLLLTRIFDLLHEAPSSPKHKPGRSIH
ncbi:MAG: hypothetical protein JRI99_11525 [Deltaproteobacteria bacterium]|nr:hypothetical protein [Deltaproteobacteria bacterium]